MGKGTIIGGGTGGQYQVELALKRDRIQGRLAAMNAQIAKIDARIAASTNDHEISMLTLQKTALQKRIIYLNNQPSDPTVSAWCADLTEDLTGEVGTIEVPGERGEVNIQPGHGGNAAYESGRDGQLGLNWNLGPAGAAYNLAMLPGWQKWKPTYRYGTITAIDGDTCDVSLDVTGSSQMGLNVNQAQVLYGVEIQYMTCNGAAFEVGDDVLVKFEGQSFASPKVVGFKTDPQPCAEYLYVLIEMTGKTSRCIVWDVEAGAAATDIPLNGGGFAVFPCDPALISEWHGDHEDGGSSLYGTFILGETSDLTVSCTPPDDCCGGWTNSGSCSAETSLVSANVDVDGSPLTSLAIIELNGECQTDPYCRITGYRSFEVVNEAKGKELEAFGPPVCGFWNLGLWDSYMLAIEIPSQPNGSTTSLRVKREYSLYNESSCTEDLSGGVWSTQNISDTWTIITPIGAMDPIVLIHNESEEITDENEPFFHTDETLIERTHPCNYEIVPVVNESYFKIGKFSRRTIVQIYFYECILTSRERDCAAGLCYGDLYCVELPAPWPPGYDPEAWTINGYERIPQVIAQADVMDDTTGVDPRTMTRNAELESVLLSLVNAFYAANGVDTATAYDIWQFTATCEILQ